MNKSLKIALPNKGRLYQETLDFLESCALFVRRENDRQYHSRMEGIEKRVEVIFQRASDIPKIVDEGRVDLGITGFDLYSEMGCERVIPVFPDQPYDSPEKSKIQGLPYGNCSLMIAVPDHWVDVTSISDLAELAMIRKKEGRMLRVATEFPNLTENHLVGKGVMYFKIIEIDGAAESAPRMGSADLIADLKSSGVTLAENRLKGFAGGDILSSQACLIASKTSLSFSANPEERKLRSAKQIIDRIEARIRAKKYYLITANIEGREESDLYKHLREQISGEDIKLLGKEGPTIAKVLNLRSKAKKLPSIYSISVQVEVKQLEQVIGFLRENTGRDILVTPVTFVFDNKPEAYENLERRLK